MSTIPPDFAEAMGEDAVTMHEDLQALANIITLHTSFNLAPDGSAEEDMYGVMLEQITEKLLERPDKAVDLVTGALSLIFWIRTGNRLVDFFGSAGVEITPIVNDETGERA